MIEKSDLFDIGLLSFNDWSIYESGLNSNRLSFYLDAQIIPFVIANHMFEPQIETKLLKKFRQDQLEKASEKLIRVAKQILANRQQYFHRKHDLFISRSIDQYVPIIGPFFRPKDCDLVRHNVYSAKYVMPNLAPLDLKYWDFYNALVYRLRIVQPCDLTEEVLARIILDV